MNEGGPEHRGVFATTINCMDGRTQIPTIEYMKKKYGVDYVDMITEPGPIKILSENKDTSLLGSIRRRVEVSVLKHGSRHIAIVGHHDCAGNPVDKDTQLDQIARSIGTVRSWGFGVEMVGLWIDESWKVQEVK